MKLDRDKVSQLELLNEVAGELFKNEDAGYDGYHRKEIEAAFERLSSLATGLDVNINFKSIQGFEPTPERSIFHLLDIPLYHGCIVNPKDDPAREIGSNSYDDLSCELAALDQMATQSFEIAAQDQMATQRRDLFRKFVNMKASWTNYGLSCLRDAIDDGELGVLFHDEHFSTMFKHEGELYLLASQEAFLNQPRLVWEKLNEDKRGNVYFDSNFQEFKMDSHGCINSATLAGSCVNDEQLARSLQLEEEYNVQQQSIGGSRLNSGPQDSHGSISSATFAGSSVNDEQLARSLQLEEECNVQQQSIGGSRPNFGPQDSHGSINSATFAGSSVNDEQLARSLQLEEEYNVQQQSIGGSRQNSGPQDSHGISSATFAGSCVNDEQLARSLQLEEEYNVQQQSIGGTRPNSGPQDSYGSINRATFDGSCVNDEQLARCLQLEEEYNA